MARMTETDASDVVLPQTTMSYRRACVVSPLTSWTFHHEPIEPAQGALGAIWASMFQVYPRTTLAGFRDTRPIADAVLLVLAKGSTPPELPAPAAAQREAVTAQEPTPQVQYDRPAITATHRMVADIQQWLSLNITELARVFQVERATVYAWLKGATAAPRQRAKLEHLQRVFAVAQRWRALAGVPLDEWRRFPVQDERSLVDVLATLGTPTREIDAAVERALQQLHTLRQEAAAVQREGLARAERFAAHAPPSEEDEKDAAMFRRIETDLAWYRANL